MRIAYLAAGNVGIELFEFVDPKYEGPGRPTRFGKDHWVRGGCFHIALTHPDPEALCAQLVAAGGEQIGVPAKLSRGIMAVYVQDPWGTVLEVRSWFMNLPRFF